MLTLPVRDGEWREGRGVRVKLQRASGCCAEELRSHPEGGGEPLKGCSVESSMVGFVNRTLAGRVNCLGKEVAERRSKQRD